MDFRAFVWSVFFTLVTSGVFAAAAVDFSDYDDARSVIRDGFQAFTDYADTTEVTTSENCTERSFYDFPTDLFTRAQREQGAAALHFFAGVYAFFMVALVCNDYFLPSVDCICTDLKISRDVAAATFMATATCTPELFVNLIGTFLTESDLGIGAVVGSGVFNTFGVAACGGLAAVGGIQMEWWPLSRDCIIYSLSIALLATMMWDGIITWREATLLMVLYFVYFIILFCDKATSRWANQCIEKITKKNKTLAETPAKDIPEKNETFGTYRPYFHGELVIEYRHSLSVRTSMAKPPTNGISIKVIEAAEPVEEYVEPGTPFTIPKRSLPGKMWWFFLWPLRLLLFVTVPDCRYKRVRKFYPLTFFMCIFWIAVTSYIVSWMITVVGDTIGIADAVMGLTFLAGGGSLPEAVSSVIMARQGDGAMGLSNSIGANTLDILLCLGLPWLIKTTVLGTNIEIISATLNYSFLTLMVTVVLLYGVIAASGYRLNKKVGVGCAVMYIAFLVYAVLLESNVFFFVNWPMCDATD
ncbi:sodium/potassium/calcium exchanger 4-like [Neodiprion fabricii]|uniref:sodium/potassium/calcium exchanger 4-like n=1 Tax=Neodiprion fabricii TaxID=2872261 RepID=UPI001ED8C9F1|nr:sodium/potassium/calcium exchanger 4-like [Neodiprion fabricii]